MKIKVILFDFFGTLAFLAKKPSFLELLSLLRKSGISFKVATEMANSFFSFSFWNQNLKNWEDFVRLILTRWDKKPKEGVVQEITSFLKESLVFKFYEDAKEIVKLPFKKAILTTAPRFLLDNLSLGGFEKIFTPKETKVLKPNPKAFLIALKNLGVSPKDCLMVGDDLERDIIPAKKLGMEVVLIDRENKIKDASIKKISSLRELKNLLI